MKKNGALLLACTLFLSASLTSARADIVFSDNFESGNLSQWTGKLGLPHHGQIVSDPFDALNHVLNFTDVNAAGDIFSTPIVVVPGQQYLLSFNFLAFPTGGVIPSEYGGFAGLSTDPGVTYFWIAGTYPLALTVPPPLATPLATDGFWHHYEINLTDLIASHNLTSIEVMLEDWNDHGSIPGDVYFDNIQLIGKPAPLQRVLFADNFEQGNLDQWTGKVGLPHHGEIVNDPLNPENHVINFTALNTAGDIFTFPIQLGALPRHYTVSFDFLALPTGGNPPVEFGGFFGLTTNPGYDTFWIAGTYPLALTVPPPLATTLATDGQWHHYTLDITDLINANHLTAFEITMEDWRDGGGIPGDVYFDNVSLEGTLDPSAIEQLVPCDGPATGGKWKNHGQYVVSLNRVTRELANAGLITEVERQAVLEAAAQSDCGKR